MIRYKAEEYGIQVIVREERYTSRQSALDFDQLPNYGDKNANLVPSSGKRIGGLFIRSNGQKINADVNGCLNIGRKELGDGWLKKLGGLFDAARYCPYRVVTRMGVPPPTPRRSPPRGSRERRALLRVSTNRMSSRREPIALAREILETYLLRLLIRCNLRQRLLDLSERVSEQMLA